MRLCGSVLLCASLLVAPAVYADEYAGLYKAAGWPVQVEHFDAALKAVQEQYKANIPTFLYQAIVVAINQRFVVSEINQRGEAALRKNLVNPTKVEAFFSSELGAKIVHAETEITSQEQLSKNAEGVPVLAISEQRRALFKQLSTAIPYQKAVVEVSLALTDSFINTVEQLFPNMGIGAQLKQFTPTKQHIEQQIGGHLENTLVYVYRDLTDMELQRFIDFAESPEGNAYYTAAQAVIYAGLNEK